MRGDARNHLCASIEVGETPDAQSVEVDGVLPPHERSRACVMAKNFARPRTRRRRRAIGRTRGLVGRDRAARGRICSAPGALGRRASSFLRRAATVEVRAARDEAAGAFRAHSVPRLARRLQPGLRTRCCEFNDDFLEGASRSMMKPVNLACWWMVSARSASPACAAPARRAAPAMCLSCRLAAHARRRPNRRCRRCHSNIYKPPPSTRWIMSLLLRGRSELEAAICAVDDLGRRATRARAAGDGSDSRSCLRRGDRCR